MEKTGEVREGITPCDHCAKPATSVVGKKASCKDHGPDGCKSASCTTGLKSFTEPLEDDGKSDK